MIELEQLPELLVAVAGGLGALKGFEYAKFKFGNRSGNSHDRRRNALTHDDFTGIKEMMEDCVEETMKSSSLQLQLELGKSLGEVVKVMQAEGTKTREVIQAEGSKTRDLIHQQRRSN